MNSYEPYVSMLTCITDVRFWIMVDRIDRKVQGRKITRSYDGPGCDTNGHFFVLDHGGLRTGSYAQQKRCIRVLAFFELLGARTKSWPIAENNRAPLFGYSLQI